MLWLPLRNQLAQIAVVGPLANLSSALYGAKSDYDSSFTVTVLQGARGVFGVHRYHDQSTPIIRLSGPMPYPLLAVVSPGSRHPS